MKALITGSTGFIGNEFISNSIDSFEHVYLLCRKGSEDKISLKVKNNPKCSVVIGDLVNVHLSIQDEQLEEIYQSIETIIHIAGAYSLSDSAASSYRANVIGTQNMCYFSKQCLNLKFFHYISSYVVNSIYNPINSEDDIGSDSINEYSRSKINAETLIRKFKFDQNVKLRIYRPGVVIGNSLTGYIPKIDGPYYLIETLLKFEKVIRKSPIKMIPIPFNPVSKVPLIPVDTVSLWLKKMIFKPSHHVLRIYHLLPEEGMLVKDLITIILGHLGMTSKLIPIPNNPINKSLFKALDLPESLVDHFYSLSKYSINNRKEDYPELLDADNSLLDSTLGKFIRQQVNHD